jgi:hypothetical protein
VGIVLHRSRVVRAAVVVLSTLAATPHAAHAARMPVSIHFEIDAYRFPPIGLSSTGVATVYGWASPGSVASITPGRPAFAGSVVVPVLSPTLAPVTGLLLHASASTARVFYPFGGTLRGVTSLRGFLKACVFGAGGCSDPVSNVVVPLTPVGAGGARVVAAAVDLTVIGAPWTTGTAALGTITRMGFADVFAAATTWAPPSEVIQLVTPVFVSTNIAPYAEVPTFATLTLRAVPEPVTLVLLGSGIAALVVAGRRRR